MATSRDQNSIDANPAKQRAWVLSALDEFETRLVRYALRLLGDEAMARDVVQYAFLRLCDQAPHEHKSGPAKWLFAVVRNRSTDVLRTRGRERSLDAGIASFGEPCSSLQDVADIVEQRDLVAMLRGLLEELPAAQREAVDLWSEGFTYREIATITGRAENTLRVMVHRTIASLREHPAVKELIVGQASCLP